MIVVLGSGVQKSAAKLPIIKDPHVIEIEIDKSVYLPCYHHMLDKEDDVLLFWGGRDSGKTHYIAQRLVEKCLSAEYFRCLLVRETFSTIEASQYQAIKDVVTDWGMEELFEFRVSPLGIKCKNGNSFLCRGCDDPGKIKSVKDPTDVWFEEGNQIKHEDYITISTSLRSNKAKIQQWFSFNPEHDGDLEEFWIYKVFFKDAPGDKLNFSHSKVIEFKKGNEVETATISYSSCHTTYRDNPYVSSQRIALLEELRITNSYFYEVFTLGNWGVKEVISPFCKQYKPEKHESRDVVFVPGRPIYFSMDFNIDPFAINLYHMWRDEKGPHVHQFDEMSIDSGSVPAFCDEVRMKYGPYLHLAQFTGDAMGKRRDISQRDHSSLYTQIRTSLKLAANQFSLPSNPFHANSRADVNYFLYYFPDFKAHPVACLNSCRDYKTVQCDIYGEIIKKNRHQHDQRADHLDAFRYFINTFLKKWIIADQKVQRHPVKRIETIDPKKLAIPDLSFQRG